MANRIKGLVSKNKRRFQADGFDLDLTYIRPNVIAMGFPAEKLEGVYRNHIDDVVKFLEQRHKGHYKVYNLCSERSYDKSRFHGCVQDYPFDDHHPPLFRVISQFCTDVDTWLKQHSDHVAVVHCKAGKGRTGVMICAYLVHSEQCVDADAALHLYSTARTMDKKGVTIPSQRRYVQYYSDFMHSRRAYQPICLTLHSIRLDPVPHCLTGVPQYIIRWTSEGTSCKQQQPCRSYSYRSEIGDCQRGKKLNEDLCTSLLLTLRRPVALTGDIVMEFFNKPKMMKKEKLFHFWFNTFFVTEKEQCQLERSNLADCSRMSLSADDVTDADAVHEAHQQREQLQCHVMDHLHQLDMHSISVDDTSLQRSVVERSSWRRCRQTPAVLRYTSSAIRSSTVYRTLQLTKSELDKANKDTQHKLFPADFTVKLYLTSDDDIQPQNDSVNNTSSHLQTPVPAVDHGTTQLSDFDDSSDGDDDLSETDDDDVWQTAVHSPPGV